MFHVEHPSPAAVEREDHWRARCFVRLTLVKSKAALLPIPRQA
jgi:hypothetical protein